MRLEELWAKYSSYNQFNYSILPEELKETRQKLENVQRQLAIAKEEVERPFVKEAELQEKLERLAELNVLLNMDEKSPAEAVGLDDEDREADYFDPDTGELILGDIMISVDKVYAQAEEYGHTPRREYAFLIAHSMLHLLGYDHMEPDEAAVMEQKQEEILNRLGITRNE